MQQTHPRAPFPHIVLQLSLQQVSVLRVAKKVNFSTFHPKPPTPAGLYPAQQRPGRTSQCLLVGRIPVKCLVELCPWSPSGRDRLGSAGYHICITHIWIPMDPCSCSCHPAPSQLREIYLPDLLATSKVVPSKSGWRYSSELRWDSLEACQQRKGYKHREVRQSVNKGSQELLLIVMGFGLGFKAIGVFSQLLRFLFFIVHFSKSVFNHNQEKGGNPVVLCNTEGCNRAISGEKKCCVLLPVIFSTV